MMLQFVRPVVLREKMTHRNPTSSPPPPLLRGGVYCNSPSEEKKIRGGPKKKKKEFRRKRGSKKKMGACPAFPPKPRPHSPGGAGTGGQKATSRQPAGWSGGALKLNVNVNLIQRLRHSLNLEVSQNPCSLYIELNRSE